MLRILFWSQLRFTFKPRCETYSGYNCVSHSSQCCETCSGRNRVSHSDQCCETYSDHNSSANQTKIAKQFHVADFILFDEKSDDIISFNQLNIELKLSLGLSPVTVAGQKKKGNSKLLSLDKEPKEDERKRRKKSYFAPILPCLLLADGGVA